MRSRISLARCSKRLIADRKFLAAYYTDAAAAALLAGLSIDSREGTVGCGMVRREGCEALRIRILACVRGRYFSTVYQRIGQLHELAGGDAEALHPDMMRRAS